jgi:fructosamine-3-kinase
MRRPVYQLYHVLNHAVLFGNHYMDQAREMMKGLAN